MTSKNTFVSFAEVLFRLQSSRDVVFHLIDWTSRMTGPKDVAVVMPGTTGPKRHFLDRDGSLQTISLDHYEMPCGVRGEPLVSSPQGIHVGLDLGRRRWGVIEIRGSERNLTEEQLETLRITGRLGALALRNAHVFARLKHRVKGVTSLYRVGRTISSSLDLGHLLELILSALRDVVPYHAAGIYLLEETKPRLKAVALRGYRPEMEAAAMAKLGQGLIGWAADNGEDLLVGDVLQDKHYINARNETQSEMVALLRRGQRIVGAFNVESDLLRAYTRSDLMLLKAFASQAAVAVDNATLYEDALEKRRLEDELSLAWSIQKRLLPSTAPHIDGWEIAGLNVPAARVGGDYYDFIDVSDGVTGISIADVSGKGVPAALVMATFRASLLAEILNEYSIETILHKVNELLVRSTEPPVFVTAVYGTLETRKGMFTYCNAGHLPPLLIPAQGEPRELQGSDLLLGCFSTAAYHQRIVDLSRGDVLILYTDGISEAMGMQGEEFGTERLAEIAAMHKDRPAVEIRDRLYAEAVEFAADPAVLDDMTAVVIKRL